MSKILACALAGFWLTSGLQASAAVLMVDFGLQITAGSSLTNSPYHTANVGFLDTTWNRVQTSDITADGLKWSDGSTATGVSLNVGRTTSFGETSLDLSSTPISSGLGGAVNTGIYSDSSPGKDGIYSASSSQSRYVGFQLGGMDAGLYEILITGRNTSTGGSNSPTFFFGTSNAAGNFAFAGMQTQTLSYINSTDPSTDAWVEGVHYVRFTVNLQAGQYMNVASIGSGNELRGFLNSVQIAEIFVPEPTTVVFVVVGWGVLGLLRTRKLGLR